MIDFYEAIVIWIILLILTSAWWVLKIYNYEKEMIRGFIPLLLCSFLVVIIFGLS